MKITKLVLIFFFLLKACFIFSQTEFNKISTEEKIYGLSTIWKEAKYNFAYFERFPETDWDNEYKKFLTKVINSQDDIEYYTLLQEFISILKEGHTYIIMPNYIQSEVYSNTKALWFTFTWVDDKMYINSTRKIIAKDLPIGSQIIKINNLSTDEYLNIFRSRINSSFEHTVRANLINYLSFDKNNYPKNIECLKPDGEKIFFEFDTINPEGLDWTQIPEFDIRVNLRREPSFTWIKDSIAYFDMAGDMGENLLHFFDSIYPAITESKGLIVDLRYSQGGSSVGNYIISHFTEQDTIKQFLYTRTNNAFYRAFGAYSDPDIIDFIGGSIRYSQFLDYYKDRSFEMDTSIFINTVLKSKRINIPLVFLIDNFVGSATESLLISLKTLNLGTFVGEPTSGSCTQPLVVMLPENGFALIASQKTMLYKNEVFTYIKPDIEVRRSLEEVLSGKDKIFDVGLDILKEKIR